MRLELYNEYDAKVNNDLQNEKQLGFYGCKDDFRIHVVDLQPAAKQENYTDVSKVQKFELSEEEWLKRGDNLRAFKEKMKEQQRQEMIAAGIEPPKELDENSFKEEAEKIKVGDRCQCQPGDRLGSVQYVGRIAALKPGYWVGVQFDEPVGKSDGSVKGTVVFSCPPLYGGFLRPDAVEVGDFPPEEF
ncbi:tubulin-specific chaperone [Angomonas deanei]|nr:tubulin-specific chaperone [Angomonas deanei]|eukprot:EPY42051.1 tubulin-specific chaperone [Angomonas deanei]